MKGQALNRLLPLLFAALLAACGAAPSVRPAQQAWMPDLGDGSYQNPVLHADYSDPDAIRVGDMYYLTSSSFNNAPGLPLLQSPDMVNWTLVGHALPQQVPLDVFASPQHGKGVWAPCLRYHDGKFWIFYPDPDFGVYVMTATEFAGPWTAPRLLLAGKGIIDPTPLWDDDGQAYLLHAWAKSRAGIANQLTLRRMAPDASRMLDDAGKTVIDGNRLPNYTTLEGPKLYKHDGYYYVFAPAGGVEFGWQSVFRSRRIDGPYEDRIVMAQGRTPVNGPHQGAWVRTQAGDDWFLHFQDKRAYGRVVHLQPMRWRDGWPVIGEDVDSSGAGQPVSRYRKPVAGHAAAAPATSDEFDGASLGLQWQWNANWKPEWYSLSARAGYLRLHGQPEEDGRNLWDAPSLLLQKLPAESFTVTTRMDVGALGDGGKAGLIMYGADYAWLGARREGGKTRLALVSCYKTEAACVEREEASAELAGPQLWLRMQVRPGGVTTFSYSRDEQNYTVIGKPFTARMGRWVGAQMGLFAMGGGHVDIDYFHVTP
ncbi:glycoside hydrolase [Duganella sp. BJB488]|nr:glycoside hydrolase [Duganella sp. BJB489]RFP25029.1 glycoside hydrolase [Duganella sp. BJB488]RFP33894.1 glycoside hydrolase [Duganella sp. BJB480]